MVRTFCESLRPWIPRDSFTAYWVQLQSTCYIIYTLNCVCVCVCVCVYVFLVLFCVNLHPCFSAGWQRSCWCTGLRATSSSEWARAGLATLSLTGESFVSHSHIWPGGPKPCPRSLSSTHPLRLFDPQCRWPLQTFHDRCVGGRPLRHRGGEQASPLSSGHGGLSQTYSHPAFQSGADCPLWTGEE